MIRHAPLWLALGAAPIGCDRESTPEGHSAPSAVAGATGESSPGAPSPEADARPTRKGTAKSYRMRVKRVKECKAKPWYRPKKGRASLGVEVEIEATGAPKIPANVFYAKLIDSQDREYRAQLGGCEPALNHRPLARGDKAEGFITFEVPDGERNLTMRYSPFILDGASQEVSFEIRR